MALDLMHRWPILANWKFFFVLAIPLIFLPLLLLEDTTEIDGKVVPTTVRNYPQSTLFAPELLFLNAFKCWFLQKFKCAYVIILMAIYWMVEAIPLAITSFLPVILFPLFGVESTG